MGDTTLLSQATPLALCAVVGWALWKLFREYVVGSPLDILPGPERSSVIAGNLGEMISRQAWDFHARAAEKFGPVFKYHGPLGTRGLYVFDPKALNSIIVKNPHIYEEPEWLLTSNRMIFGVSIGSTTGEHHRRQRKLLNPVFHVNHMRSMAAILYVIYRLRDAVKVQVRESETQVDVLNWMSRAALELIGQGGLGYSFDPLTENKSNAYGEALKGLLPTLLSVHFFQLMAPSVTTHIPLFIRRAIAPYVPIPGWKKLLHVVQSMDSESKKIFYSKRQALEKGDEAATIQIGEGRDITSILMKADMQMSDEERLSDEELLGQMSFIVFAATDTTSNSLARIFHILAGRQDVQDRLRAELIDVSADGEELPYDTLVSLPYPDAVCRETLRLYPPVSLVLREPREDMLLPLSDPVRMADGQLLSEIPVPKGTTVLVSIQSCNRNKALWGDDALEWKPERWLEPPPKGLTDAHVPGIYSNLMTFLGGGRACLGFKFSQLEMKLVLAVMIRAFRFLPGDEEIVWNIAGVNYPTMGEVDTKPWAVLRLEPIPTPRV